MQNVKGFEKLVALKETFTNEYKNKWEKINNENKYKDQVFYTKYGFKNPDELISWVLDGNKIIFNKDETDYMMLVGSQVAHIFQDFDDCIGPLGRTIKYTTIEAFKEWVNKLNNFRIAENKEYFDYWSKSIEESYIYELDKKHLHI